MGTEPNRPITPVGQLNGPAVVLFLGEEGQKPDAKLNRGDKGVLV